MKSVQEFKPTLQDLFGTHMQAKMFQKVWEWQEKEKREFMNKIALADQYDLNLDLNDEDADVLRLWGIKEWEREHLEANLKAMREEEEWVAMI